MTETTQRIAKPPAVIADNIYDYLSLFKIRSVFSAVEALKSKSSIVAINVASLHSHWIWVITFFFSLVVLTFRPIGVLKLSGEIALETALAVFSSRYSSVIAVSNFFSPQLLADKLICGFNKFFNLIQWNLRTCRDIVSSSFAAISF